MSGEIRVLYVDDHEETVEAVAEYLEHVDEDIVVHGELDPTDALERISAGDFDCLVSDYKMAGVDGIDFLKMVREKFDTIPFIFYTGRGSESVASEAIAHDATDYVKKSADGEDYELLRNRIHVAVERYRDHVSYRELFDNVDAGVCVRDLDSYAVLEVNEALCTLLGYDQQTIREQNLWGLTADLEGYSTERSRQSLETAVLEGTSEEEWPFRASDGSVVWAAVSHTVSEIRGDDRILTTIQDITTQKQRERELQRRNTLFEQAERLANIGAWEADLVDGTGWWSDEVARIYGLDTDLEPDVGEGLEYFHPEDRPTMETAFETLVEEGEEYDLELRIIDAMGQKKWVHVRGEPVYENGNIVRVRGSLQDITERKRYEQQLKEQRDNLETLNEMVRHDIRNDLQLILAYLDTVEPYVQEAGKEYHELALDSTRKAVSLTRTARDLSEAMLQTDIQEERINLHRTLRTQIEEVRSAEPSAEITMAADSTEPTVRANDMIDSVFRNILKNAIEHNDKDVPVVEVTLETSDGRAVVSIADNGPGIPDSQKDNIFVKGEKGLDSTGSGIGLYLVETLVDQYDGSVSVGDNDPEGTVFTVELPLA